MALWMGLPPSWGRPWGPWKCGLRLLTGPSQSSQSTSNGRSRHAAGCMRAGPQVSIWAWEILGNLPGPWFFPFGKDREITCLSGLLWGHKNGHKAFSQIQSPGLQNALELSHEKSNQRRSRDFAGFPESSLRMWRIFITSPCFLQRESGPERRKALILIPSNWEDIQNSTVLFSILIYMLPCVPKSAPLPLDSKFSEDMKFVCL